MNASLHERTGVDEARDRLANTISVLDRQVTVTLSNADGRVLAEPITAPRDVPHYTRAAMDGYAIRAEDTEAADSESPVRLQRTENEVEAGKAVRVHTGSPLPEGADTVIMIERTEEANGEILVFNTVNWGDNVAPAGEDIEAGDRLFGSGHRLVPPDLGLLKSTGIHEVSVVDKPRVSIIPTGEEIVGADPGPGEMVETNGLVVSEYVHRWGGNPNYRGIVADEPNVLEENLERELSNDVVVMIGGSSVGERDIVPETVARLGEVFVHGVAIKPGHPVALGEINGTPIIMLPGYPVSSIINAVQFLRPSLNWLCGRLPGGVPSIEASLQNKLPSEVGVRTYARVRVDEREGEQMVVPIQTSGAGILSSVTQATGWVEVDESRREICPGERVAVQNWDCSV